MALLWQQAQAPRVGLRRERLSYGHELMNLPESAQPTTGGSEHVEVSNESEVDILAPPKSDSSEAASPKSDSPSLHSESSPPTKRRKLHSWTNQHVDLTSPPPVKKGRVIGESRSSQPSNIRATQFTSSDPSSARSSSRGWKPVSHSQGLSFEKSSEPKHPFAEYYLSQSRPGRPYGKPPVRNFHKARPPKPEQQKVREEAGCVEPTVLEGTKGYKIYDTKAIQSSTSEIERSPNAFRAPVVLSPSPRSKRAIRRSANNVEEEQKPAQDRIFRKPPRPPSPKFEKHSPPPFIMPQRPSSRDPPVLSAANLDTIKAKLNIEIDAPTSSAALSSGPSFEFDIEDGNSSSSLSSAPEVEELDFEQFNQEWRKDHPPTSPKKRCPICEDLVSRLFMEEFSGSAILSVRQQQKFCRAHKVRSAEETWRANGYPSIDWFQFAKRLQNYGAALGAVLNGTRTSFYRNAFEDQIKSGANRTLQQAMSHGKALEGLDMGYYGTKGGRIMMDHIMSNFASRIRKLAGTEKLVSAAGVSGFVQAVLAPELAVMLVKDDMQVDEEQARVILKESSDIGHLLNEEEDEAIKDEEERETLELE